MQSLAFINYRQSDSLDVAGRIADRLKSQLGEECVFFDVADIPEGAEFPKRLVDQLENATVLLVVIGPEWIKAVDQHFKRRIDQTDDWVRREILFAIEKKKTIIPVLVGGQDTLPSPEAIPHPLRPILDRQYAHINNKFVPRDTDDLIRKLVDRHGFVRKSGVSNELGNHLGHNDAGNEIAVNPPGSDHHKLLSALKAVAALSVFICIAFLIWHGMPQNREAPPSSSSSSTVKPDSPPATTLFQKVPIVNKPDLFDVNEFYYLEQGTGFVPLRMLRGLKDPKTRKPFLDNLERFGLISGEASLENRHGLLIGLAITTAPRGSDEYELLGFTCAACHTAEFQYAGTRILVLGAPSRFSPQDFVNDLDKALLDLFHDSDPERFWSFIQSWFEGESGTAARQLFKSFNSFVDFQKQTGLFGLRFGGHVVERWQMLSSIHEGSNFPRAETNEIAKTFSALASDAIKTNPVLPKSLADAATMHEILEQIEVAFEALSERLKLINSRAWLREPGTTLAFGFGRDDHFGAAAKKISSTLTRASEERRTDPQLNAPVRPAPLWNTNQYARMHWNSSTNSMIQSNIIKALAVGATFDSADGKSSVNLLNQAKLAKQIERLKPPKWPEEVFGKTDQQKVERGWTIYREFCANCHSKTERNEAGLLIMERFTPFEIGTDNQLALSEPLRIENGTPSSGSLAFAQIAKKIFDQSMKGMSDKERATIDEIDKHRGPPKWLISDSKDGKLYPARSLEAVWASAPYLHNGSIPTLYHLLLPVKYRPSQFVVGSQDFLPKEVGFEWDPKSFPELNDPHNAAKTLFQFDTIKLGNSNSGHEFGTDLSDDDRWALIEYLKVHEDPKLDK